MGRIFILFICAFIAITTRGETNFFHDGAVWNMQVGGTHTSHFDTELYSIELDGDTIVNGNEALKMHGTREGGTRELISIVRVEGEKIYFQSYNEADDWTLLYDFGLTVGEGCTVGIIDTRWPIKQSPITTYIECIRIAYDDIHNYEVMYLAEFRSEDNKENPLGHGTWIKGLGSPRGVNENSYFEALGRSSTLLSAYCKATGAIYTSGGVSGIEIPTNETLSIVYVDGNNLCISNLEVSSNLEIYSGEGSCILDMPSPMKTEIVTIPQRGIYIIKNGNRVRKVIIL